VLIGILFLLFGALRMGWVAAFIATPVMRGFIEGLIGVTIIGQVASLLGLHGVAGNFFAKLSITSRAQLTQLMRHSDEQSANHQGH